MKRVTGDEGSSLWMMHRLWRSDASWRKAGKDKVGQARPQKYICLAMSDFNVESLGKYRTVYQESESDSSCSRSTMKIQFSRHSHLSRINCWLHIRDFVVIMSSRTYASLCQQIKFVSAGNPSRMKLARVSFPSVSHSGSLFLGPLVRLVDLLPWIASISLLSFGMLQ